MIFAGLLLAAAVGPVLPDAMGYQTIYLSWDAETKACDVRVGSLHTGDPATDEGEAALLGALSGRQGPVQLQERDGGVPYICVDTALPVLRRSGRAIKFGFMSEPVRR